MIYFLNTGSHQLSLMFHDIDLENFCVSPSNDNYNIDNSVNRDRLMLTNYEKYGKAEA